MILLFTLLVCRNIFAFDQIIRPYQSIRTSSMGGVLITTGHYDQNFFGNPARVAANPESKIQLPDLMAETTIKTVEVGPEIAEAGKETLIQFSENAGTNLHARIQSSFPGVYLRRGKMGYAFAFLSSIESNISARSNYYLNPGLFVDYGPVFSVGRRFLEKQQLSIGLTLQASYRAGFRDSFGLLDLLGGKGMALKDNAGQGSHIDGGLGAFYSFPFFRVAGFVMSVGASVNQVLGGNYRNLDYRLFDTKLPARRQPRTFNGGTSFQKKSLWVFSHPVFALEVTDIGNNGKGSFFRLIHMGSELKYGLMLIRYGLGQGYPAAGLGVDLGFFSFEVGTYGEELTLNVGRKEDRRYAARLAFQI